MCPKPVISHPMSVHSGLKHTCSTEGGHLSARVNIFQPMGGEKLDVYPTRGGTRQRAYSFTGRRAPPCYALLVWIESSRNPKVFSPHCETKDGILDFGSKVSTSQFSDCSRKLGPGARNCSNVHHCLCQLDLICLFRD